VTDIAEISASHYAQILRINQDFVHWLSPMDQAELSYVLARAEYARQIGGAAGVLIGYGHDIDYPGHENLAWLKAHIDKFFYIDRIIIDQTEQGRGFGRRLYADVETFARARGDKWLACEVNSVPNNPRSHSFHQKTGFKVLGEQVFTPEKVVRYYAKALKSS